MDAAKKYGLRLTGDNMAAVRQFGLAHKDLDEAVTGLQIQLGVALLQVLADVARPVASAAQVVNQDLTPAFNALGDAVKAAGKLLGEHKEVQAVLVGVLGSLGTVIAATTAASVAHTAATAAATLATNLQTSAQWLLNAALTANPIGLII